MNQHSRLTRVILYNIGIDICRMETSTQPSQSSVNDSLHCVVLYVFSRTVKHKAAPVGGLPSLQLNLSSYLGAAPGYEVSWAMHIFILDKGVRPVAKATNFTYVFLPGNSTLQSNEVS